MDIVELNWDHKEPFYFFLGSGFSDLIDSGPLTSMDYRLVK